jgi:hypothetical protein
MANIGKWAATTLTTVLTTELNALATVTMTAASATYDNSTNLNIYCDLELFITWNGTPAAGAYATVYILEAPDGTNFPGQSTADLRLTTNQLFCTIPLGVVANSAQRVPVRNLVLPPAKVQFIVDNQSSIAYAASGNTMKILTYNINGNG